MKLNWKVAGVTGLAAGLTVGGFSMVSASGIDQAISTVALAESQTAPAADGLSFVASRTTTPSAHVVDPASQGTFTVEMPSATPAQPAATIKPAEGVTPKPVPAATEKHATAAHVDDSVDSVASVASVASVDSAASVASVDSID